MLYLNKWGPYLNNEGRQIVVVRLPDGKKKTTSYARYLLEQKLGRYLTQLEEADHIDNNFYNDHIDNLQILSLIENRAKGRSRKYVEAICKYCKSRFLLTLSQYRHNQVNQQKDGPFCSKSCVGKAHH